MPIFRNRIVFELARNVRAFLNLEAAIIRGKVPEPETWASVIGPPGESEAQALQKLKQTHQKLVSKKEQLASKDQQLARQGQRLKQASQKLTEKEQENSELRVKLATSTENLESYGVRPENIIWIFGTARTGSTWLSDMMKDLAGYDRWHEPLVGDLFGHPYYIRGAHDVERREHFVLGDPHRESWLGSIRAFILREATARFPEVATTGGYLIVKEPNGSIGAPLLMEALPESRMIFLMRDPRDIVASLLDANSKKGWLQEWKTQGAENRDTLADPTADNAPDTFVQTRAGYLLPILRNVKQAYDAHEGYKTLLKYEDLRVNTLETMQRVYSVLNLPLDKEELAGVVERHAWERIPQEKKGEGKFFRRAEPGGWREDLTPHQAEIVEQITGTLLKEYYPT